MAQRFETASARVTATVVPRGRQKQHPQVGQRLVQLGQRLEGACRTEVQVVEPQQDGAIAADPFEDLEDGLVADCRRIEEEAFPGRTEGHCLTGRRRAKPFRRGGDEQLALVVVVRDLPAVEQRLFDQIAVGPLQAEMRIDGADHAVERRRYSPVARSERDHEGPLVHLLAEPFREPALADTGFSVEQNELLPLEVGRGHVLYDGFEIDALFVARHERARPKSEESYGRGRDRRLLDGTRLVGGERRGQGLGVARSHLFDGGDLFERSFRRVRLRIELEMPGLGGHARRQALPRASRVTGVLEAPLPGAGP
jgi:hypothetical protein